MLATLSRRRPGHPFGSVMPYALDEARRPLFLISSMAMHTQNLEADRRASLLVTGPGAAEDPLAAGRVTLIGEARRVPAAAVPACARALPGTASTGRRLGRLRGLRVLAARGRRSLLGRRLRRHGLGGGQRLRAARPRPALRGGTEHRRAHEPRSRRFAGALRSSARGGGGRRGDHARGGPPRLQAPARESAGACTPPASPSPARCEPPPMRGRS